MPTAMHGGVQRSRFLVFNSSTAFAIQPVNGLPAALSMQLYNRWCRGYEEHCNGKVVAASAAAIGKKPAEWKWAIVRAIDSLQGNG